MAARSQTVNTKSSISALGAANSFHDFECSPAVGRPCSLSSCNAYGCTSSVGKLPALKARTVPLLTSRIKHSARMLRAELRVQTNSTLYIRTFVAATGCLSIAASVIGSNSTIHVRLGPAMIWNRKGRPERRPSLFRKLYARRACHRDPEKERVAHQALATGQLPYAVAVLMPKLPKCPVNWRSFI